MERLGAFEVGEELARGGFGIVHAATHHNGTPAAVKLLKNLDPDAIQREVYAVARLDHPNIVAVFDQGTLGPDSALGAEGTPYFVMERCSGGSLSKKPGKRDWDWLRTMLTQLLDAMAHAHAHGVIHLDIKPANILFAEPGDPRPGLKLVDFGISLTMGTSTVGKGTPTYMAPEQYDDQAEVGPWTDLYALGIVGWMSVSGRPFEKTGTRGLFDKCTDRLAEFNPRFPVPDGLEAWLRTLLRGTWSARYLTAAAARQALADLDSNAQGFAASQEPEDAPTEIVEPRRSRVTRTSAGAALARLPSGYPATVAHVPVALQQTGLALLGLRDPPFIGHEEVCRRLWDAWREIHGAHGRILVTGLVDVGRRRCLHWLAHQAHAWAGATAPSLLDLDPEFPARDLLCRALSLPNIDLEQARARLVSLEVYDDDVGTALDELFAAYDPRLGPVLAIRVLGALGRRLPVLLCFPDTPTDSIWLRLSREIEEPIAWAFSGPQSLPDAKTIEVEPLDQEAMATSLREWLPFEPTTVERLVRAANGFPGSLVSLVRQSVSGGALETHPEGWALDPAFDFGGGLESTVLEEERQVVSVAAWLGPWCDLARLTEAVGPSGNVVKRLVREGIWRRKGGRIQFVDPRHRPEAMGWIDPALAARVAQMLAALEDHRRASRAYVSAGDVRLSLEQTVRDLVLNERRHQPTRIHAVQEALGQAEALEKSEDLHGQLWIAEARCHWESGSKDAAQHLMARQKEGETLGWHELVGVCAQYLRLARQAGGDPKVEIEAYRRMKPGRAKERRLGIAYRDLALLTQDTQAAREAHIQSLTHLDHDDTRYAHLYGLCELQLLDGDEEGALSTAWQAIAYARARQPDSLTNALVHLCSALLTLKRFAEAAETAGQAAARARMLGAAPALMISLGNQALALANLSRWQESAQVASQALRYTGYPTFATVLRTLIATQAARTANWDHVEDIICEAEAVGVGFKALGWDARWSLGALAIACSNRPDLEARVLEILATLQ